MDPFKESYLKGQGNQKVGYKQGYNWGNSIQATYDSTYNLLTKSPAPPSKSNPKFRNKDAQDPIPVSWGLQRKMPMIVVNGVWALGLI